MMILRAKSLLKNIHQSGSKSTFNVLNHILGFLNQVDLTSMMVVLDQEHMKEMIRWVYCIFITYLIYNFRQMDNHTAWEEKMKIRVHTWSIKVKHLDQDNMMFRIIDNPLHLPWEQSQIFKKIIGCLDLVSIRNDHSWTRNHKEQVVQM